MNKTEKEQYKKWIAQISSYSALLHSLAVKQKECRYQIELCEMNNKCSECDLHKMYHKGL